MNDNCLATQFALAAPVHLNKKILHSKYEDGANLRDQCNNTKILTRKKFSIFYKRTWIKYFGKTESSNS